jgi:asparagine synthase (glutamine-hydrolysing)
MCGFISCKDTEIGITDFIKRRGEDAVSTLNAHGHFFYHSLLSLTGEFTPQPFVDGKIFCVYNGEIYNQFYIKSDGECLITLYKKYGEEFPRYLDGEFAVALFDFENKVSIFTSDSFRTKPIYYNNGGAASYPSGLKNPSHKIPPNTTIIKNLVTGSEKRNTVHDFDFDNQTKKSYDDWINMFETAICKRAQGKKVFLGLSSGYDSGAIHCTLRKLGIDYKAYTIAGAETLEIINSRGVNLLPFTKNDFNTCKEYVRKYMEDYEYNIYGIIRKIRDEDSLFAMAYIMQLAKKEGYRIYLSGTGGDEIISDYGCWPSQSEFKGKFPEKLKPWGNFYSNCMDAYLAKEEHVGGCFSVETRYPFLDLDVVQEFLWLHVDWKNKYYKAPLHEYFLRNNYPFEEGKKLGFDPKRGI